MFIQTHIKLHDYIIYDIINININHVNILNMVKLKKKTFRNYKDKNIAL